MVSPAQSVFLFIGNDAYSKEEALKKLGDSFLDSSARSMDFKVFRGSQSNATEIIENISTIPFLAPKRLVVIKEFEKLSSDDRARIVEHTKKPLKTASLIIDSNEDSILKDFGRVPKHISVKTFGEPSGSDLTAWISRFFSQKGKKIKPEAIEFLKETRSGNLSELSGELEKLILFVGIR
nr:hypothetical protein [Candidatus Omnitrophota bacterium]